MNQGRINPELEKVLNKQLGRVKAPADLWFRMNRPAPAPRPVSAWTSWAAAAAALLVMAGAGVIWTQFQAPATVEAKAVAALNRGTSDLTLHTSDTKEIRSWVRANAGIDIPLPPKHSPVIQVNGVRLDGEFAEISYQVGDFRAALLVSKNTRGVSAYPQHEMHGSDPYDSARVTSWSLKGQSYTLATASTPNDFRTACLLCHDQVPTQFPPMALNIALN